MAGNDKTVVWRAAGWGSDAAFLIAILILLLILRVLESGCAEIQITMKIKIKSPGLIADSTYGGATVQGFNGSVAFGFAE